MLYDQYTLLEQSTQNFTWQVDEALIVIREENQESFTQMHNVRNTQIANVTAMQQQTEMFAK
jgi:hypothetical protein